MDRSIIQRYADGGPILLQAIKGLDEGDLQAFPVPGTWSIRQIVIHVLDSDLIATHRMKRIVAEEKPLLIAYDETAFAKALFYDRLNIVRCCELFAANRAHTAEILGLLPDAAFARQGVHNQSGLMSLQTVVENYTRHLDHHLKFIREKRALLGKPLL
ncbi:MAG: DinB family protein [Planctomycetes bacterium]|nr:DinB family protein [Planctomycetota bacterium]